MVSLDILDCERAVSIIGMRNGSIGLCDPRQPNLNPNRSQNRSRLESRLPLNKKQRKVEPIVSDPSSVPQSCESFQCCIDHIKLLSDGRSAVIKDIVGNISLFDVRRLSKVVMPISRSDPSRFSRIDFSRFFVDNEESMLFTTSIDPQCHQFSSVEPFVQVWSLKSESSFLRKISFASIPRTNVTQDACRFDRKIDAIFASKCSSFGNTQGSQTYQSKKTNSLTFGEYEGSYFCSKTECNTNSIYCLLNS